MSQHKTGTAENRSAPAVSLSQKS